MIFEPINKAAFSEREQFSKALVLLLCGFTIIPGMMVLNVSAILLVRSANRSRDVAIRIALGASGIRIMLAGLLEALSLGLVGGLGAFLIDYCLAPVMIRFLPPGRVPLSIDLHPNLPTMSLIFIAAATLSVLFGVVPAFARHSSEAPRGSSRRFCNETLRLVTRLLVLLQSAGTILVLIETGLTLRTYDVLRRSDPAFKPHR